MKPQVRYYKGKKAGEIIAEVIVNDRRTLHLVKNPEGRKAIEASGKLRPISELK